MKKILLLLLILFSISIALNAQQECGAVEFQQKLCENNPEYEQELQQLEETIYQLRQNAPLQSSASTGLYTIPIVIHVIHESGTPIGQNENLSDEAIYLYINSLNEAYRHTSGLNAFDNPSQITNEYSGVDTEIEFCLATTDPNGNPTTGINRFANTAFSNIDLDNEPSLISTYGWSQSQYYNIFIVKDIFRSSTGGGIAGYAGTLSKAVNSYDASIATWVHETGHYLSLLHSFGPNPSGLPDVCEPNNNCLTEGDRICDTPPHKDGDCTVKNSCTNDEDDTSINNPYRPVSLGGLGDQNDFVENYMSYFNTSCRVAFSIGQKNRMRDVLENTATGNALINSNKCQNFPNISCTSNNCELINCTSFNPNTSDGPNNTTVIELSSNFPSASTVGTPQICINIGGDIGGNSEVFDIIDESGVYRGTSSPDSNGDCSGFSTAPFCFTVSNASYAAWTSNNIITITLDPVSLAINPSLCNFRGACATISIPTNNTSVSGCTNTNACNYNPSANVNDGSCEYTSCAGCLDPAACNYDNSATIADSSCEYASCANDICSSAILLSCNSSVTGKTTTATSNDNPATCTTSVTAPGVWYRFTGTGGSVTATTCSVNSNYDTKLHVYSGNCSNLTCVIGNDDDPNCSTNTLRSTVNFNTLSGITYYIFVSGFSSNVGDFQLFLSCTSNCPTDIIINSSISSGMYEASNSATSNGNVIYTNDVTIHAGNYVQLNPGFDVPINTEFTANTVPCGTPPLAKPISENLTEPFIKFVDDIDRPLIHYYLPEDATVSLKIKDKNGNILCTLMEQIKMKKGKRTIEYQPSDASNMEYIELTTDKVQIQNHLR